MAQVKEVIGCCPLDCQDTCSWIAHVEDDRVTRVVGAKDHPITRGVLCAKVNDYQARTYAPERPAVSVAAQRAQGQRDIRTHQLG